LKSTSGVGKATALVEAASLGAACVSGQGVGDAGAGSKTTVGGAVVGSARTWVAGNDGWLGGERLTNELQASVVASAKHHNRLMPFLIKT
jgi:hypothetical protein